MHTQFLWHVRNVLLPVTFNWYFVSHSFVNYEIILYILASFPVQSGYFCDK